jgi:hypothetical protein
MEHVLETRDFFIIPRLNEPVNSKIYPKSKKSNITQSYFDSLKPLSKKEIKSIIQKLY